jgi:hypothetical protein
LLCGFSDLHRLSKNHIVYVVLGTQGLWPRVYESGCGPRAEPTARVGLHANWHSRPRSAYHL